MAFATIKLPIILFGVAQLLKHRRRGGTRRSGRG